MPDRQTRQTRLLTVDDFAASVRLGTEAFGDAARRAPTPSGRGLPVPRPPRVGHVRGRPPRGAGDRPGVPLVVPRRRAVPTCGIAGVAVAAERRGRDCSPTCSGRARRGRRSAARCCRRCSPPRPGSTAVRLRAGRLLRHGRGPRRRAAPRSGRPASGVTTRRATAADFDAVREVYDTWAAAQNGPLTRRGPSFPATPRISSTTFTGVTLAVDEAGRVVGFAAGDRGDRVRRGRRRSRSTTCWR